MEKSVLYSFIDCDESKRILIFLSSLNHKDCVTYFIFTPKKISRMSSNLIFAEI